MDLETEKKLRDRIQAGKLKCKKCRAGFRIVDDIVCFKSITEKDLDKKIKRVQEMFFNQELNKEWIKHFTTVSYTHLTLPTN